MLQSSAPELVFRNAQELAPTQVLRIEEVILNLAQPPDEEIPCIRIGKLLPRLLDFLLSVMVSVDEEVVIRMIVAECSGYALDVKAGSHRTNADLAREKLPKSDHINSLFAGAFHVEHVARGLASDRRLDHYASFPTLKSIRRSLDTDSNMSSECVAMMYWFWGAKLWA